MSIQNLREQRAAKAKSLSELVNKTDWNAEKDQPIYDQGMAEIDDIDARIKRIVDSNEKIAAAHQQERVIDAAERVAHDKNSVGSKLFAKWLRKGDNALNAEEWQTVRNTMSTTTGSEGGFTVQTDIANQVIDALKEYGGMRQAATVIRTSQGNTIQFPTSDGTSEVGEIIAQNTTATDLDISFGNRQLITYKYSSKTCPVPIELLQDSAVDIEGFVRDRLVTRLARITNTHFTVGTGTNQPQGLVTGATAGVTAANATSQVTTITYSSLVDLVHSVDPAYRHGGRSSFMMADSSVRQVRKILDGQNRPIFTPGFDIPPVGVAYTQPDTLLGYPIIVNQDVPAMAASARSIVFGNIAKAYTIRDVMDVTLFRFTDSPFTKLGQVGFLAWMRAGGNILDVGATRVFINAAS